MKELLNKVLDAYKVIEDVKDTLEQIEKTEEIRRNLIIIINQHLSDVDKIASDLKKFPNRASKAEMSLELLQKLLNEMPQVVFVPSNSQLNLLPLTAQDKYKKEFFDFHQFFLSKLVIIWAYPHLSQIHGIISKIIFDFLDLLQVKNYVISQSVHEAIINLFQELSVAQQGEVTLKSLWNSSTNIQEHVPISSTKDTFMTEIEIVSLNILQKQFDVILQLNPFVINKIWRTLMKLHQSNSCRIQCLIFQFLTHLFSPERVNFIKEDQREIIAIISNCFHQIITGVYEYNSEIFISSLGQLIHIFCESPPPGFNSLADQQLYHFLDLIQKVDLPSNKDHLIIKVFTYILTNFPVKSSIPTSTTGLAIIKIFNICIQMTHQKPDDVITNCVTSLLQLIFQLGEKSSGVLRLIHTKLEAQHHHCDVTLLVISAFATLFKSPTKESIRAFHQFHFDDVITNLINRLIDDVSQQRCDDVITRYCQLAQAVSKLLLIDHVRLNDVITCNVSTSFYQTAVLFLSTPWLSTVPGLQPHLRPDSVLTAEKMKSLMKYLDDARLTTTSKNFAALNASVIGLSFARTSFAHHWRAQLVSSIASRHDVLGASVWPLLLHLFHIFLQLDCDRDCSDVIISNIQSTSFDPKVKASLSADDVITFIENLGSLIFNQSLPPPGGHLDLLRFSCQLPVTSSALDDHRLFNVVCQLEAVAMEKLAAGGDCHQLWMKLAVTVAKLLPRLHANQQTDSLKMLMTRWPFVQNRDDVTIIYVTTLLEDFTQLADVTWFEVVTKKIDGVIRFNKSKVRFQCRILGVVSEVALKCGRSFDDHKILSWAIGLLCCSLSRKDTLINLSVINKLSLIDESELKSFYNVRSMICENAIREIMNNSKRSIKDIFNDLNRIFSASSPPEMIKSNIKYLLPITFVSFTEEQKTVKKQLLSYFTDTTGKKRSEILMDNFIEIFTYGVVHGCQLETLFDAFETETRVLGNTLVLLKFGFLIQFLCSFLCLNKTGITNAVQTVNKMKLKDARDTNLSADLTQTQLLAVLTYFNSQLKEDISLMEKKQIFESLIALLEITEKMKISKISVKIINTLCLTQHYLNQRVELNSLCCLAWYELAKGLNDSILHENLCLIVVLLLPFIKKHSEQVLKTINYLVVVKVSFTKSNFDELYFLNQYPIFDDIVIFMKDYTRMFDPDSDLKLKCVLQQITSQIKHENTEVRHFALDYLCNLLRHNQTALHRSTRDIFDGYIPEHLNELIATLTSSTHDNNSSVRLLAVKCIAQIAAVDSNRMKQITMTTPSTNCFHFSYEDSRFAHDLLSTIVEGFLIADPLYQDNFAFAIQELLKIFRCSESSDLWTSFNKTTQNILQPHLSSRYLLKKTCVDLPSLQRPLLNGRTDLSYQRWLGIFCVVLVQMATSSDEDEKTTCMGVFNACVAVVNQNINVAEFLLPYLMVESLKREQFAADYIISEINAVLTAFDDPEQFVNCSAETSKRKSLQLLKSQRSQLLHLSAQTIFKSLDYMVQYQRVKNSENNTWITYIFKNISAKKMAQASYKCGDYERAILYYEDHIRDTNDEESREFFEEIFHSMKETDGITGIVRSMKNKPNQETQVKLFEMEGAHQDAVTCYERMLLDRPHHLPYHVGQVKSLINLGRLTTAISTVESTLRTRQDWEDELNKYRIEACWRLGDWGVLSDKVHREDTTTDWNMNFANLLLTIKNKNWSRFSHLIEGMYKNEADKFAATNSYRKGYDYVIRLHMLADAERISDEMQKDTKKMDDVITVLEDRLDVVHSSFQAQEPILSFYRVLIPLLYDEKELESRKSKIGELWLRSCRLARKESLLQVAFGSLMSAEKFNLPQYAIEHSKYLYKKDLIHEAIIALQWNNCNEGSSADDVILRGKYGFLMAKLMEESSRYSCNTVLMKYKEVIKIMPKSEEVHFRCARYYLKVMSTPFGEKNKQVSHLNFVLYHFGEALCQGTTHIYESLTKLLTLWLSYTKKNPKKPAPSTDDLFKVEKCMRDIYRKIPCYIFYVAFSQILSQICHENIQTYAILRDIVSDVIRDYPQQALWSMMAVLKSSNPKRANRCQEIFNAVKRKNRNLVKLISDYVGFTDKVLDLCNKGKTSSKMKMSVHFKPLKKMVESASFSQILVPLRQYMTPYLPQPYVGTSNHHQRNDTISGHVPFPRDNVYIVGFHDEIEVIPSLQAPKKIKIKASNGTSQNFLCKPKDDLRKDARLTELASIINKCLKMDSDCNKRRLQIRTYAVIPLKEDSGIIEWVSNTKGLRVILLDLYKKRNLSVSNQELKSCRVALQETSSTQKKLEIFKKRLLSKHPPVFYEWFLSNFQDPVSWYNARKTYSRSLAVMSMVGYIVGLGDRHGENILFDSLNGEAMHVDFNCLFNKGLSLEVPEIVPFRLTHNMVDAMGVTGYEGFFRQACEVTMKVLRQHREPLMSVLHTFLFDPLLEWIKKSKDNNNSEGNERGLTHVADIDNRLRGFVSKNKGLSLSVQGHVDHLIQEATNEENLSKMYIGWAAYL